MPTHDIGRPSFPNKHRGAEANQVRRSSTKTHLRDPYPSISYRLSTIFEVRRSSTDIRPATRRTAGSEAKQRKARKALSCNTKTRLVRLLPCPAMPCHADHVLQHNTKPWHDERCEAERRRSMLWHTMRRSAIRSYGMRRVAWQPKQSQGMA